MTLLNDLYSMDNENIRRLTVLETKLDYLIEHSSTSNLAITQLSVRVAKMESSHQWIAGGAAVLMAMSGVLLFAFKGHVQDLITEDYKNIDFLLEVCNDIREKRPTPTEYLTICNL